MAAVSTLHPIARLWCWHLLHFVYSWIACCLSLFYCLKCALSFICFPSSRSIRKLPRHLALLVDSEDVVLHLSKVVMLLQQLSQLGLRHISMYDAKGISKSLLPGALKRKSLVVQTYSHNAAGDESFSQIDNAALETPPSQRRGHLLVELLSLSDGKQTIVEACRNICLKSLQSGTSSDLREEDVDLSLKEIGGAGPDPDLLLLFSNSRCLQGFPPWRLRLTEIQHIGSIKDVSEQTIFLALDEFSHKHHRYGK